MGARWCILGWTSREREKQQKGRKTMNERRKAPLSPAWGLWVHPSDPQESSPWLPHHRDP